MKTKSLTLLLICTIVCCSVAQAQTPQYQVGTGEYNCFILNNSTHQVYSLQGIPSLVPGMPSNIVSAVGGAHHWLFIDNSGNVWAYGDNQNGECGNGTTATSSELITTPIQVTTDSLGNPFTNVIQVIGGNTPVGWNSSALKSDGTVWIWGSTVGCVRGNGQQGQNNTRPVQINFPAGVFITKIQIDDMGMALDSSGNVWTWGGSTMDVGVYALGQGTNTPDFTTPHMISLPSRAADIAGGCFWNYALLKNGSLYGWSYFNPYLGIGDGGFMANSNQKLYPQLLDTALNLPHPIKSIQVNNMATYALLSDSTIWAWGDNACGGMGNGVELNFAKYTVNPTPYGGTPQPYAWDQGFGELMHQKPIQVAPGLHSFTNVFVANSLVYYAYAEDAQGNLYAWGRNKYGVIANGVMDADPNNGNIGAIYPHSWDVPYITKLNPFALKSVIQSTSPYCLANPSGYPCNLYTNPVTPPPTISAGLTQNITTSSTTLQGTAVGNSGATPVYTIWTQLSGPDTSLIILPSGLTPQVTGLVTGKYVFQLNVTDNNWNEDSTTVIVNVNLSAGDTTKDTTVTPPPVVSVPVANAGSNITLQLPKDSAILSGLASTDSLSQILGYQWAVLSSSPTQYKLTGASSGQASLSDLAAGVYQVQLTVIDALGSVALDTVKITVLAADTTVTPPVVSLPVANAGTDVTLQLPKDSTVLSGLASTDSLSKILGYQWTVLSGSPTQYKLAGSSSAQTILSDLEAGVYQVQLTVVDALGGVALDTVKITVLAAKDTTVTPPPVTTPPVALPVANAGANVTLQLPKNSTTLSGLASTDSSAKIVTYTWSVLSGSPSQYNLTGAATNGQANLSGLSAGIYQVKLTVTDANGKSASDVVQVTVLPAAGAPIAVIYNAATNVTLPVSGYTLDGTHSSAPSGDSIVSYVWQQLAGPSHAHFQTPDASTSLVDIYSAGTYLFELTVKDNAGDSAQSTVVVKINPAPAPVANAGANVTLQLPNNTTTLSGLASTDSSAKITTYLWTVLSGSPSQFSLVGASTTGEAILSNLVTGVYQVRLTVTDANGISASDTVQVTVLPDVAAPVAVIYNAATNVTLPVSGYTLDGTHSSAPSGDSLVSYVWQQLAGPSHAHFQTPDASTSLVDIFSAGTYLFELTVKDGAGNSAQTTVIVKVNPTLLPVANAGANVTLQLPNNTTTLSGLASTDSSAKITTYLWTVLSSSPTQYKLSGGSSAQPILSDLEAGVYQVQLTVTDANGNSATDIVQVTVLPDVAAPVAVIYNAATNVTLPASGYTLDGTHSYAPTGDSLVSYVWQQIAGPSHAQFQTPDAAETLVDIFSAGTYLFELTVKDNAGNSAQSTVTVKVNPAPPSDSTVTPPPPPPPSDSTQTPPPDSTGTSSNIPGETPSMRLKIFPVPAQTVLNVVLGDSLSGNITVNVFDERGRLVQTQTFAKAAQETVVETLNVAGLVSGTYFLQVLSNGFKAARGFIKIQ